jgi:NTP pyrophosphatase (non-canonical NTP hydrolase)
MTKRDTFLLVVAMEEAGEFIRGCSKVFRHGANKDDLINLSEEAGDVQALIQLLEDQGLIDREIRQKKRKARYKKHK